LLGIKLWPIVGNLHIPFGVRSLTIGYSGLHLELPPIATGSKHANVNLGLLDDAKQSGGCTMSEYQYYEFQAIDRPLTAAEQDKIEELSSRVQLTANRAIFTYSYGNFRSKPEDILAKYFDMMLYIANWGTWQLIFRLPKSIMDTNSLKPYLLADTIGIKESGEYIVLDISIQSEEGMSGWIEGEGWLSKMLPLRDELLSGDLRLLYLVWLRVAPHLAEYDQLPEDPIEPPLPPNLGKLSSALKKFIEWVELDSDLVTAAAQASPTHQTEPEVSLEAQIPQLTKAEQQEFLVKLLHGEAHLDRLLANRLKEIAGGSQRGPKKVATGQRTFSQIATISETVQTKRETKERNAAEKQREKELAAMVPREKQMWQKVVRLIEVKQARPYDEATALLKDLRDLAAFQGRSADFKKGFAQLKIDYQNRPALIARFNKI
jgi:hypothetical protein